MSNGKSAPSSDDNNNMKSAADLLLKGGTLLGTACDNCGGVQIRFKENTVCINCGRKIKEINSTLIEEGKIKKEKNDTNNNDPSGSPFKENILIQSTRENDDAGTHNDIKDKAENTSIQFLNLKKVMCKKIKELIVSLENDHDVLIQNSKLDLISKYLDVLYKINLIRKEI